MKTQTWRRVGIVLALIGLLLTGWSTQTGAEEKTVAAVALADLEKVCPGVDIDLKYATDENFTHHVVYPMERAFLVEPAARALASVQADLASDGFGLRVLDAYRPLAVQREFWRLLPDSRYVANPKTGSRHNRGASVDVTLVDSRGSECEMPTAFDDFSERAGAFYPEVSDAARRHRRILQKAMTRQGFRVLETEWWHFDYSGWKDHPLLDVALNQVTGTGVMASGGKIMTDWRLNEAALQPFFASLEKKNVGQVMLVLAANASDTEGMVQFFEKKDDGWVRTMTTCPASIGRNGVATPGSKREGDGMSPHGFYPIGIAFGYEAATPTRMPYVQMTAEDIWVDDPASPDYNHLVKRSATRATSFEEMRRKDDLYKFGLLVEYNTSPVVAGRGSAIFIHIWSGRGKSTSGCVAFPEERMKKILAWLDPAKKPHIAIGTRATLFPTGR